MTFVEPCIVPAAPVLNNPTQITAQRRIQASVNASNKISTLGCPYVAKDGVDIPSIYIGDHGLDGCAGVIRVQNGHIGTLTIERVSLLNGGYASGVACGLVLMSAGHVDEIIIRDCDYSRSKYITSPGDIYAAVFTGGGHDGAGNIYGTCNKFTIQRVRARNAFTNYPDNTYPNSDGIVFESTFINGLIDQCDLRYGADAGIDRKGTNCRVQGTIVEGFRENFKTWTHSVDGDVYSRFPRFAHWLISGNATEQVVEFAEIVGSNPAIPVVKFEHSPGILRLQAAELNVPEGQVLAKADQEAFGSKVIIGDRVIEVNQAIVML